MKRGMTLVEVLVSLLILSIIMAGIIIILQVQQSRAISVRSQAVLHTEAQVGLSILKWDIFLAGYAMPDGAWIVQDGDGAGPLPGRDVLTLRGGVLGLESRQGRWNQIITNVRNQNTVMVRRWDEPDLDFTPGDRVMVCRADDKQPFYTNIQITDRDSAQTERGEPAWLLTLSQPISASMGSYLFMIDQSCYSNGIQYSVQPMVRPSGTVPCLVRRYGNPAVNEVLLENVEDFQVQYGIDYNNNGIIDAGEWSDSLPSRARTDPDWLRSVGFMMRFGIVNTTDRPIPNYTYPNATINLFNNSYNLNQYELTLRRVIMFEEIKPRNIVL